MKRVGGTGLGPLHGRSERRGVGRKKGLRGLRGVERAVGVGMVAVHEKRGSGVIRIFFGLIVAVDSRHPKRGARARKRHRRLVEKNRVGACCDVFAVEREPCGEIADGSAVVEGYDADDAVGFFVALTGGIRFVKSRREGAVAVDRLQENRGRSVGARRGGTAESRRNRKENQGFFERCRSRGLFQKV